ncbi:MAG TPA: hypothetical protein VNL35_05620 [Chloroflexota bacterium]|nr:hypothetical protein [Chloroflexota bacterium]
MRLASIPRRLVLAGGLAATSFTAAPAMRAAPAHAAWLVVASPAVSSGSELFNVTALSRDNVWAVGAYGSQTARTLIEHFDGTRWRVVASPNVGKYANFLYGLAAVSPRDIWAVGTYYTRANTGLRTLILHYDGNAWTHVRSPNSGPGNNGLGAVTVIPGTNQLWAVGDTTDPHAHLNRTLILRYNGADWAVVPSPNVATYNNGLGGVAAVSANHAWAVGGYNNTASTYRARLVLEWNGVAWKRAPAPTGSTTTFNLLSRVIAISAHDVWAVGYEFTTIAEHFNGSGWSVVPTPKPLTPGGGENTAILYDVSAASSTDIWAVGIYYLYYNAGGGATRTLAEHWDGAAWHIVPSPNPDTTGPATQAQSNMLFGVAAVPGTRQAWAVGRYLSQGTPNVLIERYG